MEEITMKRLVRIKQRKAEIDEELKYAEFYQEDKAEVTWDENHICLAKRSQWSCLIKGQRAFSK